MGIANANKHIAFVINLIFLDCMAASSLGLVVSSSVHSLNKNGFHGQNRSGRVNFFLRIPSLPRDPEQNSFTLSQFDFAIKWGYFERNARSARSRRGDRWIQARADPSRSFCKSGELATRKR